MCAECNPLTAMDIVRIEKREWGKILMDRHEKTDVKDYEVEEG